MPKPHAQDKLTTPMPRDTYEYRMIRVRGVTLEKQMNYLNKYAQQGWRVVAYIPEGLNLGNYVIERHKNYDLSFSSGFIKKHLVKAQENRNTGPRVLIHSKNIMIRFIHHCVVYGNWSIGKLAKETSKRTDVRVSESAINYWFRGQNIPKLNTLQAVLSVLGFGLTIAPLSYRDQDTLAEAIKELDIEPVNDMEYDWNATRE